MAKIYGFTLLRNGIKYDYSFRECLLGLSKLVDKIYIAVGESDDGTKEALAEFPFLEIIDTVWDPALMGDGGQILSEQTNVALKKLREDHGHEDDAWGFYLQCDELIHEDEVERIKEDIEKAQKKRADAIRFRYLHFWKDHYHIAISKRWYPHEVRAIKLKSDILSFGDAQGFSGVTSPYESECSIYHYGHVRDEEKLREKQEQLIRFIRPAEKFKKYFNREKKAFKKTKMTKVLLDHPSVMKNRIERLGDTFLTEKKSFVYIVGKESDFSKDLVSKVNVDKCVFVDSISQVPFECREKSMVIIRPTLMDSIMYPSKVATQMESPLARPWNKDFLLMVKLSEKGVGLRAKS